MRESVLELEQVAVAYDGRTVLDLAELRVRRGEVLTLLGENGSGKTTLLRMLGLLLRPGRGRVVFDGEEVDFGAKRRLLELRRRTAAVMQEPLLCRMSVQGNVALGLRFRGAPRDRMEKQVGSWLERLSISHLRDRPAAKLSGGEAQRTSLARAMALDPEVLFLDEPFGALDAPTRQSLLRDFRAVLTESGVTTVFATHDRGEALGLGDRVAVLTKGRVAQVGSAESVFSRPETIEVARFVGMETEIPGRIEEAGEGRVSVECGGHLLKATGDIPIGEDVFLYVRPEEVEIRAEGNPAPDGSDNVLTGRVISVIPAESHYRVEVDCGMLDRGMAGSGMRVVAFVSRAAFREMPMAPGQPVRATFPADSAHLIRRPAGTSPVSDFHRED